MISLKLIFLSQDTKRIGGNHVRPTAKLQVCLFSIILLSRVRRVKLRLFPISFSLKIIYIIFIIVQDLKVIIYMNGYQQYLDLLVQFTREEYFSWIYTFLQNILLNLLRYINRTVVRSDYRVYAKSYV